MQAGHSYYATRVLQGFKSLRLPLGTDEFEALLLYQQLYESATPLFALSDFDPARRAGYESLLQRWAYDIWRHRTGPRLVQALRRSARRYARRGLDFVVIVGLLHQVYSCLSRLAECGVSYADRAAWKAD
ncbi:MAG: hypothetical protein ABIK43_04100 [candidate division WOR-3 bacterium]